MEMNVHMPDADLEGRYLVEGFPGVGLVAKISADYLAEVLDMDLYAEIFSAEVPSIAVYEEDGEIRSPVRIYISEEDDILVLKSDVPIASDDRTVARDLNDWIEEEGMIPIYQLGIPMSSKPDGHGVMGVYSGEGEEMLDAAEIEKPSHFGLIFGPTGGMMEDAVRRDMDAVALTVPSEPRFPDPESARNLVTKGVCPLTGLTVDTEDLKDSTENIKEQKQSLMKKIKEIEEEEKGSQYPTEMYI